MTDERLDQILKQALAPEIDDSEIQIRRKVRNRKMNMKKIALCGLTACAAVTVAVTGGYFRGGTKIEESNVAVTNDVRNAADSNFFAITARAAELPEGTGVASGDVMGLSRVSAGYGSAEYLDGRFSISGQNIEKIKISTDQCDIYTAVSVYEGDAEYDKAQESEKNGTGEYVMIPDVSSDDDEENAAESVSHHYEHLTVAGKTYEGSYNEKMQFGMSVPEELRSKDADAQKNYHENVDQVNGATLTIEVTFSDGTSETHHYRVKVGKVFVPVGDDGYLQWDNLTRFLTTEEESEEVCYEYGYLLEKID